MLWNGPLQLDIVLYNIRQKYHHVTLRRKLSYYIV